MDTHATPRGGSRADGPLLARPPTEAEHQAAQDAAIQRIAALERQNADLLAALERIAVASDGAWLNYTPHAVAYELGVIASNALRTHAEKGTP